MARQYPGITRELQDFIKQQKIFFVGTAAYDRRVNVSPKGMDTFRIINENKVYWLNLTGSGNETAAHLLENNRMTIMFLAFEGEPMILRLYGQARVIHPRDSQWDKLISLFPPLVGARQVIDVEVDLAQTSCGMGVPCFDYVAERDFLKRWAEKKGKKGLRKHWRDKNQLSIDGKPTKILYS